MSSRIRSNQPRRAILPSLLAIAALALAGCSSDTKSNAEEAPEGPLQKYLSTLWDGQEWTQEKMDAQNLKTEELVAECMSKEGFEYEPNMQNSGVMYEPEEGGVQWGTKEFAEEYGYGLVNAPGMEEMQNQEPEEYVDPNQDYIDSLSESEQQAFYETLHGPQPTEEEIAEMEGGEGMVEYDWTTAGCYGAAHHEAQAEDPMMAAYEDPEFAELFAAQDEMFRGIWDETSLNEDISKLNHEWADCMADAGHADFTSPMTAQNILNDEYMQVQMPEGPEAEWQEPSEEDKKAFQEREIEVATTDFECREKLDYDDKVMDIQFDLEQRFVDEHKAELDAMLAKHAPQKK